MTMATFGARAHGNAGAFGSETADVLVDAELVDLNGDSWTARVDELGYSYRTSSLQGTPIVCVRARFRGKGGDRANAVKRIKEMANERIKKQPLAQPNTGSIFRNPPGDFAGRLVEAAGLKGQTVGGAKVSPKNANFNVHTGGASAERDISLATGAQIAASLDPSRFEVVLLDPLAFMARNPEITAEQREQAQRLIKGGGRLESDHQLPRGLEKQIESASRALVPATRVMTNNEPIDVVLIALHGTWGEDGRIQGLLDTIGVPYTGSGVLASALAMDKEVAKTVLAAASLDVPRGVVVTGTTEQDLDAARSVGIPAFVKPVSSGSSVGASIVAHAVDLPPAIELALKYDQRALVEEQIKGRELTVPVIGNDDLTALPVIEILTKRAFFDYSAKYDAGESEEVCPAEIPPDVAKRAQDLALRAHRALHCRGMSRLDLMWSKDRMVALEVNTIPGMTANSLLPKAARAAGIEFGDLLARFVDWALEDARRRAR